MTGDAMTKDVNTRNMTRGKAAMGDVMTGMREIGRDDKDTRWP
ncbi:MULTISPECIES: hypothetical protein [Streptomyces]|uniref:Uncharacterized protein n=2 Tax=Streptomyces TaxID=1883 RepID=A0ABV9IZK8_9ACTN